MFGMACVTVFVMLLLHTIEQNCIEGVRIGRKKIDVIHRGKPLQDLVILNSRVAPHDLDNLNAFVKPKLLEDSRDEGMMLQENGIEDFRPLDVSLETDGDQYEDEKYKNGMDQISVSDSSKDGGYDLRDMPEYNVETKADFKGNQEAIDWLMKDPNDFNVKSFEDSSVLGDTDSFSQNRYSTHKENQDETENNAHSNFHHSNDGRKRHHGPSVKDSTSFVHASNSLSLQDYDQDEDDTKNHVKDQNSRHFAKTAKWKDKYDDFQHSDYSENDNMGQGQKSWDSISDGVDEGIIDDRSYDKYDKDSEEYDEQRPRASSMKNLNQQIENQDAKLYKELENFTNIDNYENVDDTDNLGNFDVHTNDFENLERKYQDLDDREEELNSDGEENLSMSNDNISDRNQRKGDRGRNSEWKDDESTHTYNQSDNENADSDSNIEMNSESGSGAVSDKESNKIVQSEMEDEGNNNDEEKSNANGIKSAQEITNIKTNHANGHDKLKELKDHETHNTGNNQVIQNTHGLKGQENNIDKGQEDRIINEGKATQTISHNEEEEFEKSKTLDETSVNSKNENEKHIPTDDAGNDETIISPSSKVDSVKKPRHGQTKVMQNSNSGTPPVSVSVPKVLDEIGKGTAKDTGEETLSPEDKTRSHDNDEQQLIYQKVEGTQKEGEQTPGTKLALKKPTLKENIKIQLHNSHTRDYGNGEKPTSTGFRRNQQSNDPLSHIYSLGDLEKIENIISYLRGTVATRSVPTKSSRYTPTSVSLKNLYYYPIHPTPQDENDDTRGEKDVSFSEWNDWSTCSVTCGKGTSVRARVCLVTTCPQKDLLQTKTCRKRFCPDEVERESLEEHNKLRAKHFSPPLSWSVPLARKAEKIAENLAAKDFLTLDDLREPQGESLAQILYTGESTAKKAIEKWYSEIQSYSFSYPKINDKTRHFVQIVWKETKKLGLAVAKSASGEYAFVVALYDPPISSEGHLRQNILRPGFKLDLYATFKRGKRLAKVK